MIKEMNPGIKVSILSLTVLLCCISSCKNAEDDSPSDTNTTTKTNLTGTVTTFAGSGTAGSADGTGTAASFYYLAALPLLVQVSI